MVVEHKFYIGIRDIDRKNYITDKGLFSAMEDAGGIHSSMAGYGLLDIERTHRFWMVISWHLEIIRRPKFGETITVHTWSKPSKKIYVYRDFEIFDEEEKLIATAGSKWVFINTDNNSVLKVNDELFYGYQIEYEKSSTDNYLLEKLKKPENFSNKISYKINNEMIDINNHVHNLNYLDLAYKAMPKEVCEQEFKKIDIMYKKEIKLNDIVKCCYSNDDNVHIITIMNETEDSVYAILKFE